MCFYEIVENEVAAELIDPVVQEKIFKGGAYCFCLVCRSVILSETLTLLIMFEQ